MRVGLVSLFIIVGVIQPGVGFADESQPTVGSIAASAITAFNKAQYAKAIKRFEASLDSTHLSESMRITISYLRAVARIRTGQKPDESDLIPAVEHASLGLTSHAAWYLGNYLWRQSKSRAKSYDLAAQYLKQVAFPGRFGNAARKYLIEGLIAKGEIEQACRLAERTAHALTHRASEAWAWFLLATCTESLGWQQHKNRQRKAAAETLSQAASLYRRVAFLWSYKRNGKKAKAHLARLTRAGYPATPNEQWLLQRARDIVSNPSGLHDRYRLSRLRRMLPRNLKDPVGAEAELLWAQLNFRHRKFGTVFRSAKRLRRYAPTPELRAKASLLLGHLTSRRYYSRAIAQYLKIAATWPKTQTAAQALFHAAETSRRIENSEQARQLFERCSRDYKLQDSASCRWGLAWSAFRENRLNEALFWLDPLRDLDVPFVDVPPLLAMQDQQSTDLSDQTNSEQAYSEFDEEWFALHDEDQDTSKLAQRARYWHARVLDKLGQTQEASKEYSSLHTDYPFTYYGLLAFSRLAKLGQAPTIIPDPEQFHEPKLSDLHPEVAISLVYYRLGLTNEAQRTLLDLDRDRLDAFDRRWTSWIRQELGDYSRSFRLAPVPMDGGLPDYPDPGWRINASLAYPQAFAEQMNKECHRAVPKTLLWALIRAESGFWAQARSPANARGLTQVITPTARYIARKLRIRRFRSTHLYNPAISIRIGSAYLAKLIQRYKHAALAISAYNAGETSVNRWVKARGDLELDAFIEEIPYTETARYTRKLLSWWSIYRVLYETDVKVPLDVDFSLPALYRNTTTTSTASSSQ